MHTTWAREALTLTLTLLEAPNCAVTESVAISPSFRGESRRTIRLVLIRMGPFKWM